MYNEPEDFEPDPEEERDDQILEFLQRLMQEQQDAAEVTIDLSNTPYSVIGGKPIHPENVPQVHDYEVLLKFQTRDSVQQVNNFIEELMKQMPNGTVSTVTTSGEAISVDDLTWSDVNKTIRIFVEGRSVEGKLDGVYTTGVGSGISKTLIIDGKAWSVSFGVAELNI